LENWKKLILAFFLFFFGLIIGTFPEVPEAKNLLTKISLPFSGNEVGLSEFNDGPEFSGDPGGEDLGHQNIANSAFRIFEIIKTIFGILAIAWIVWAAVKMITAGGNEDKIKESIRAVSWTSIALLLLIMSDQFILDIFWGGGEKIEPGAVFSDIKNVRESIGAGTQLIIDVIEWLKAILIIIALGYLLASGWDMISSLGKKDKIEKQKIIFLWIGIGTAIILINNVIIQEVLYPAVIQDNFNVDFNITNSVAHGVSEFAAVLKFFLKFTGVLAIISLVFGSGLFIFSFSNEQNIENGKKILTGSLIGIVLILMSYVMISTISSATI